MKFKLYAVAIHLLEGRWWLENDGLPARSCVYPPRYDCLFECREDAESIIELVSGETKDKMEIIEFSCESVEQE